MPSPPIQLFLTTIASQPALRQRQEYLLRTLQIKKIPFKAYDLASDEQAKRLWKRKVPIDKQQLPGILVGGSFPGPFTDFEDAVEYNELDRFLRLNEEWDEDLDNPRAIPEQPIGVPGAMMPEKMTGQKPSFTLTPGKRARAQRDGEFDVGAELVGFGFQGLKATEDDLADLVAELGLDGDAAADLVQGLAPKKAQSSSPPPSVKKEDTVSPVQAQEPSEEPPNASTVEAPSEPDASDKAVEAPSSDLASDVVAPATKSEESENHPSLVIVTPVAGGSSGRGQPGSTEAPSDDVTR